MNSRQKQFHIVVRHRDDPHQTFSNAWLDDARLEAITTTPEIAVLCDEAKQSNVSIYVHRCGWGNFDPVVCCSVSVDAVDAIDRRTSLVKFKDQKTLNVVPSVRPPLGTSYYSV